MKITELMDSRTGFSFEVFPPKDWDPIEPLRETLDHLYAYNPDYISCTYGAGGTNKGRNEELCKLMIEDGRTVLAHYTCIGNTKEAIREDLARMQRFGVENIMGLRGDFPEGWETTQGDFAHASALIRFIKEEFPDLCVGGGCYPEKHIEAPTWKQDIAHLKVKVDAGADFLVSQLCYDVTGYERFMESIARAGIFVPVAVGIMPVLNRDAVIKMTLANGCSIPADLARIMGKYADNPADFRKAGKEYTADLILRYMAAGADGLHFYSMNRYKDLSEIIDMAGIRSEQPQA